MMPVRIRLITALLLLAPAAWAASPAEVTVYKSPSCGCCGKWVEHLRAAGFKVGTVDSADVGLQRKRLGMPDSYASCHTAQVGDYVIEGHVPAADIQRLLARKPRALGLAVPGMPASAPGMDSPSAQPYRTLLVGKDGVSRVYATH